MSGEEPIKKCVDCGQTGHTATSCNNGKAGILDLFGVRIDPTADQSEDDGYEPKSMEVLKMHNNEHGSSIDLEYMSDEHSHDTKKGIPWTEDEHRSFLMGLEKLGRGRWRAISKQYVPSRTPTQVASHAQKFFIRLNSTEDKRKRRSSLFDMPLDEYSLALGASVRPPAAPMARTYGVEGYNRFPDVIGYDRSSHIPLVNYMFDESVHPLDRRTVCSATLVPRSPPITNGERRNTQEPEVETTKD